MNVKAKNKAGKYKKIMEKKIEMKPEILCAELIGEFREYFKYVRDLQFTEEPNYNYLLDLFNNAMKKNNIKNDFKFDWCQNNKNEINNNGKFISTENLFSKLKLGVFNFNEDKDKKNINEPIEENKKDTKNIEENNKINKNDNQENNINSKDNNNNNIINEESKK